MTGVKKIAVFVNFITAKPFWPCEHSAQRQSTVEWVLQKSQGVQVGVHSFSSGFGGDSCFQTSPFSFDLLMLFMLVWCSWVSALLWKWHWPAWIKSLMLLLRAAWPG